MGSQPDMKKNKRIQKGLVLIIINAKFRYHEDRCERADADRKSIIKFCNKAGLEVIDTEEKHLKTDDLTADEMEDLLKAISKRDFSSYDAFICFISSYGYLGEIQGVDGNCIALREIVRPFDRCPSLIGIPKLFFIQNCIGHRKHTGVSESKRRVVAESLGFPPITINTPFHSDILVVYSSLNGFESSRNKKEGSWFITVLTRVLNEHASYMTLIDMLAIVNAKMIAKTEDGDWKQTPVLMSTLTESVGFKVSDRIGSTEKLSH